MRPFARVYKLVQSKTGRVTERCCAFLAFVRPFTGVRAHMCFQGIPPCERLGTLGAFVWLLTDVLHDQVVSLGIVDV